jgi:4a-hydroxytetrahydrobiopterin dehydratase
VRSSGPRDPSTAEDRSGIVGPIADGKLTYTQIQEQGLDDWRKLAQALHARFATGDFATGMRFVQALGEAAEKANHHPDVTLTYPRVGVALSSHDVGGITDRDVALARRFSEIAADLDIPAEPGDVMQVEFGLDSRRHGEISPFWQAVLDGKADGDEVVDPSGRWSTVWFQQSDEPADAEPPRQRWHPDVWVPADQAHRYIDAGVAAGGRVVDDSFAPAFVVLADPQGNRMCFCTAAERD